MARIRSSSSSSSKWRYCNPAYYLKRPKRLALLFIVFVSVTLVFWDRQTLVREHEVELSKLNEEVARLQNMVEELKDNHGNAFGKIEIDGNSKHPGNKVLVEDPVDIQRKEKVKEAMIHAWSSYEKYAWGQDELQAYGA